MSFIITQFSRDRCIYRYSYYYIFFSTNNINFLRAIWVPGALIQFTAGARQLYGGSSSCGIVNPIIYIMMRAQGHLPPHTVVHVRTSAEAPRGVRYRPPGKTVGYVRDDGIMRRRRRNIKGNEKKSYK